MWVSESVKWKNAAISPNNSEAPKLQTAIEKLYGCKNVYVKEFKQGRWYVPYYGPETRSESDVESFLSMARYVINDYPQSEICKNNGYSLGDVTEYHHPLCLKIWRDDIDDIINRAHI